MHRTQYSYLSNEEFYRLLVSQPILTPLETEAMVRMEALMDVGDGWDGSSEDDPYLNDNRRVPAGGGSED